MLNLAELKFVEGLKRVEAYCKNVYRNKTLLEIIEYIDSSKNFFIEIQTDATQHFDEERLTGYMKFLAEEESVEKCFEFFKYALALRSPYLNVLVLYHSYKNNLNMVRTEILKNNRTYPYNHFDMKYYLIKLGKTHFEDNTKCFNSHKYLGPKLRR